MDYATDETSADCAAEGSSAMLTFEAEAQHHCGKVKCTASDSGSPTEIQWDLVVYGKCLVNSVTALPALTNKQKRENIGVYSKL